MLNWCHGSNGLFSPGKSEVRPLPRLAGSSRESGLLQSEPFGPDRSGHGILLSAPLVCSLLPNTLPLPQTFHSSLEMQGPPPSSRKLVILTVGAVAVLTVSIVGVLVATYLGRATCIQRDAYGYLPTQVNVQNEASLLLALSELGEQGVAPGITCDLRNRNATLGITSDVQSMGTGSLGSLTTLLCSNKPTYLITAFAPSPRHHISMAA
ncbi:uncharacterized protein LOC123351440 isoform X2 [Mauremys mutica]|uniref:uncharacterized protein LOC123351440 isoform X2 n=1 Tax=Mauremys mutica TaxID=74926 RepID=UPI001D15FA76|nr:uncharacterized protein LOC123351440 isoform X2 [Mauremys mutica]